MKKPQKQVMQKTWKTRPAREMLTPMSTSSFVEATHDRAPPAAWRMRETISQGMKIQ
jgi:hypothetical protein